MPPSPTADVLSLLAISWKRLLRCHSLLEVTFSNYVFSSDSKYHRDALRFGHAMEFTIP